MTYCYNCGSHVGCECSLIGNRTTSSTTDLTITTTGTQLREHIKFLEFQLKGITGQLKAAESERDALKCCGNCAHFKEALSDDEHTCDYWLDTDGEYKPTFILHTCPHWTNRKENKTD